jgi:hypothetical protein
VPPRDLARGVHRHVALPAQDRPVLFAEQESPPLLQRTATPRSVSEATTDRAPIDGRSNGS